MHGSSQFNEYEIRTIPVLSTVILSSLQQFGSAAADEVSK